MRIVLIGNVSHQRTELQRSVGAAVAVTHELNVGD